MNKPNIKNLNAAAKQIERAHHEILKAFNVSDIDMIRNDHPQLWEMVMTSMDLECELESIAREQNENKTREKYRAMQKKGNE